MALLRALALATCLIITTACAAPPAASTNEASRTFFVIPLLLPDGSSAEPARLSLENWLIDRAGGFTDLGLVRGAWRSPSGRIIEEHNHAYLVSVPDNPAAFESDLRRRLIDDFHQEDAYVQRC